MGSPATGCRCGSGAHPRRCEIHPEAYDEHIREIQAAQAEDMSDEDAQAFDAHHNALEELRKNHSEFLETVEAIMATAAEMVANGAKAVAPHALDAVMSFAMAALENQLNRLSR